MNYYTYVYNNPLRYQDSSGNIPVETIADVISIGLSGYNLLQNPSWLNAGYLAWDVGAALIPYVPGSYVGKGTGALIKGTDSQLLKLDLQFFSKDTGKIINSADNIIFKQSSLDKAFSKHRKDFGNYKDGSNASVNKFKQDIMDLINTGTQKSGTWKDVKGTHVYNEKTRQWVFINQNGSFNTAFKLDNKQWEFLKKTGAVK